MHSSYLNQSEQRPSLLRPEASFVKHAPVPRGLFGSSGQDLGPCLTQLHTWPLQKFQELWVEYDDGSGTILPEELERLLTRLPPPLGLGRYATGRDVLRFVYSLDIPLVRGRVPFHRTMYELVRRSCETAIPEVGGECGWCWLCVLAPSVHTQEPRSSCEALVVEGGRLLCKAAVICGHLCLWQAAGCKGQQEGRHLRAACACLHTASLSVCPFCATGRDEAADRPHDRQILREPAQRRAAQLQCGGHSDEGAAQVAGTDAHPQGELVHTCSDALIEAVSVHALMRQGLWSLAFCG